MAQVQQKKLVTLNIFYDKNLIKILAQGWSEERLLKGQIATLTGRKFKVQVPEDAKIYDVKYQIETLEGYEIERQELRRGKTTLKDEKTLAEAKVLNADIVLLLCYKDDSFDPFKINPSAKDQQQKQGDKKNEGNKLKTPPIITQTLTVTEDEDKRLSANKPNEWWLHNGMSSGVISKKKSSNNPSPSPQSAQAAADLEKVFDQQQQQQQQVVNKKQEAKNGNQEEEVKEPQSAPTVMVNNPFANSIGRRLNEVSSPVNNNNAQLDAAARREHMRKVAEERLKKLSK